MKYNAPFGSSDPNAPFVNGDPSVGRRGSIPPAEQMEQPQREIVYAITQSGQTPSDDTTQLWQAMQRVRGSRYFEDASTTPNAIIGNLTPALAAYQPGQSFLIKAARTNTGPTSINISGLGVKPAVRQSGQPLQGGDITAGGIYLVTYDGTSFQVVGGSAGVGQNGYWHFAADTGAPNKLVAAPTPGVSAYSAGLPVAVLVANTNTGAATANISGLGEVTIVRAGGGFLQGGDLVAGSVALLIHDGTSLQLINWFTSGAEYSVLHRGDDTGPTNALVATVSPPISSYSKGLVALISAAHTNTGAVTANLNGLGTRTVTRSNGTAAQAGHISAGAFALIAFDGTNFELLNYPPGSGGGGGSATNVNIGALLAPYWLTVLGIITSLPTSPGTGDTYLVGPSPGAGLTAVANQIAQWDSANGWIYRDYPIGGLISVRPPGSGLADILERTASGWVSKFATDASVAAGTATTDIVSSARLKNALAGVGNAPIYVSTNRTLTAGFFLVDTSAGPLTLTLPANPTKGLIITLADALGTWDANVLTMARNGNTIMNLAEDLTVDVPDLQFTIWFTGSDWELV